MNISEFCVTTIIKSLSTYVLRMDDIDYSRICVIYVLCPCVVGFVLRNVRYIFRSAGGVQYFCCLS